MNLTQDKFADTLSATRPMIASYELNKVVPNDVFIKHLCRAFAISESWLRTGEGQMHISLSEDEQFASVLGKLLVSESEEIKSIIMKTVELNEIDLKIIHQLIDGLIEKNQKSSS